MPTPNNQVTTKYDLLTQPEVRVSSKQLNTLLSLAVWQTRTGIFQTESNLKLIPTPLLLKMTFGFD